MKSHKMYSQLKPELYHVVYNSRDPLNQNHRFYMLKLQKISLVFMLVPMLQRSNLFRDAEHFALLSPSQLWLIPHYVEDVSEHKPARTLTFTVNRQVKEEADNKYKDFGSMVARLTKHYDKIEGACKR